jgi:tripartite-type tricarboxylate transporter receptor subunit TctC
LPDVPTVAEAVPELAGSEARGWFVLTALTGTPDDVVQRASQTLQGVLADQEVRQKLAATGTCVRPLSPVDTSRFIQAEQELWRPLVRKLGITSP